MTGADIAWWLAGIWDDLTHLGTADVPLLALKLFVLFVALFFGWQLGRMAARAAWSVVQPLLRFGWLVVSAPVRLPWRFLKWLLRPIGRWRRQRRWRREERVKAEQLRGREREEAQRHAAALAAAQKILDVD